MKPIVPILLAASLATNAWAADEKAAVVGWGTLSSLVAVKNDAELNIPALRSLLDRVEATIHSQPSKVRSKMNGFVIALGSYVAELTD